MLDAMIEVGARAWACEEIVIGMAHRGRLNVLANILDKTATRSSASSRTSDPEALHRPRRREVPPGLLQRPHHADGGKSIHLSLAFNPSHLEVVNPVVEGRVRAKQDRAADTDRTRACCRCSSTATRRSRARASSPRRSTCRGLAGLHAPAAPSTSSSTTRSASPPTRSDARSHALLHRHRADARQSPSST